jgi:type IV pilus assembly protein PilF
LLLAACGSAPAPTSQVSERPVSQQISASDVRERAKVHTELGGLYLQNGRIGVAMEEAAIALAADPNYPAVYNLLGLAHMELQEKEAAEENFRKALRLAPTDPEINNNLGWFLCQTGREEESIANFMMAIKNPHYTTPNLPFTNAGICALRIKKDKEAEEYLLRALRSSSQDIKAIFWLGVAYYRSGRLAEAKKVIADLQRLIEPNSETLWIGLLIERQLGDREAENRFASQLRRKFPGTPEHQKLMQGNYSE